MRAEARREEGWKERHLLILELVLDARIPNISSFLPDTCVLLHLVGDTSLPASLLLTLNLGEVLLDEPRVSLELFLRPLLRLDFTIVVILLLNRGLVHLHRLLTGTLALLALGTIIKEVIRHGLIIPIILQKVRSH